MWKSTKIFVPGVSLASTWEIGTSIAGIREFGSVTGSTSFEEMAPGSLFVKSWVYNTMVLRITFGECASLVAAGAHRKLRWACAAIFVIPASILRSSIGIVFSRCWSKFVFLTALQLVQSGSYHAGAPQLILLRWRACPLFGSKYCRELRPEGVGSVHSGVEELRLCRWVERNTIQKGHHWF